MGRKRRQKLLPMFRVPTVDFTGRRGFLIPPAPAASTSSPCFPVMMNPQIPGATRVNFRTIPNPIPTIPPPEGHPQLKTIPKNKEEMVKQFILQGFDPIPLSDPVLLINTILTNQGGYIGLEHVAHVLCAGERNYETLFCIPCEYWGTPKEFMIHLRSSDHNLAYMKKCYKEQHHKVIVARQRNRDDLLKKFVTDIAKLETAIGKKISRRSRIMLTSDILFKCWPNFLDHVDNSWKNIDDNDEEKPDAYECPSASSTRKNSTEGSSDTKIGRKTLNDCLYALVFIRFQAINKNDINISQIQDICKVIGISPDTVFSDASLNYAECKIGTIELLVAIAKYYSTLEVSLLQLMKKFVTTEPLLPPARLLLDLGVDKEKTAKLVRDIGMLDVEPISYAPRIKRRQYSPENQYQYNNFDFIDVSGNSDRQLIRYDEYIEDISNDVSAVCKRRREI